MNEGLVTSLPTPTKSTSDWREFRSYKLLNGLTLTLVHDCNATSSSAGLSIPVGAGCDPSDRPGLAHFCEHMVFLGSSRYPAENCYKKLLSQHGGRSNASTSMERTVFKFDVVSPHLDEVLDVFASFFISPTFSQSGTDREVMAVDSEDSKNRTADNRRRLQVLKSLCKPSSAYSKFSTGNRSTIVGPESPTSVSDARAALLYFHRKHYKASKMTAVVVGPQSLSELYSIAYPKFSSIPSYHTSLSDDIPVSIRDSIDAVPVPDICPDPNVTPLFRPGFQTPFHNLLTNNPLRTLRKLYVMFPLPPQRHKKDRSPTRLLSSLLGHEGVGSSFAALQDKGLITGLSSGTRFEDSEQSMFQIDFSLTPEGEADYVNVVQLVLDHIALIRSHSSPSPTSASSSPLAQHWAEIATLNRIHFSQSSPSPPYVFAPSLAQRLNIYNTEECLRVGSMLHEDISTSPASDVHETLSYMNVDNMIVERLSQAAWKEANENPATFLKKEKWYGVEYALTPIASLLEQWRTSTSPLASSLSLPKPNNFIPRSLELHPSLPKEARKPRIDHPIRPPVLADDDPSFGRLFYRLDDRYALPKASLTVLMRNAHCQHSYDPVSKSWEYDIDKDTLSSLFRSTFYHSLAQETYDAELAGLGWSFSISSAGLTLKVHGYSDQLSTFASKLLALAMDPHHMVDEKLLEILKERKVRSLRSFHKERPDAHCNYYIASFLNPHKGDVEKMINATERANVTALREHLRVMLKPENIFVECLYTGNVGSKEARGWFNECKSIVRQGEPASSASPTKAKPFFAPGTTVREIGPGSNYEIHIQSKNENEENGAVVMSFQSDTCSYIGAETPSPAPSTLRQTAALKLLSHMLKEPLFNKLRTQQTLGYIVTSGMDVDYCTSTPNGVEESQPYATSKIDSIYVTIVSKKISPIDVADAVDKFLVSFGEGLKSMPQSEITNHAESLSKKMWEPHKKLTQEASEHFAKIRRFAPEVYWNDKGKSPPLILRKIPWALDDEIAGSVRQCTRDDLIDCFERVIGGKDRRRVTSFVYGSKHPLCNTGVASPAVFRRRRNNITVLQNFNKITKEGLRLPLVDKTRRRRFSDIASKGNVRATNATAAIGIIGVVTLFGVAGCYLYSKSVKGGGKSRK
mmetsp:Transcript_22399/g.46576  ORF Transcript_22399/g.46576 Transcript_22399/m.46576 type:complete len:1143 (+) Transcript_22399:186-3614(+)